MIVGANLGFALLKLHGKFNSPECVIRKPYGKVDLFFPVLRANTRFAPTSCFFICMHLSDAVT